MVKVNNLIVFGKLTFSCLHEAMNVLTSKEGFGFLAF